MQHAPRRRPQAAGHALAGTAARQKEEVTKIMTSTGAELARGQGSDAASACRVSMAFKTWPSPSSLFAAHRRPLPIRSCKRAGPGTRCPRRSPVHEARGLHRLWDVDRSRADLMPCPTSGSPLHQCKQRRRGYSGRIATCEHTMAGQGDPLMACKRQREPSWHLEPGRPNVQKVRSVGHGLGREDGKLPLVKGSRQEYRPAGTFLGMTLI